MAAGKVAMRYAKSVFSLAVERNEVEKIQGDMVLISQTVRENHDLAALLRNPIVGKEKKVTILEAIFKKHITELSNSFVALITRKGRESYLKEIADGFGQLYRESKGIIQASVRSVVAIDQETKERMVASLGLDDYKTIEFEESLDQDLIGGYVVRVEDRQIDASVSRQLRDIKQKLIYKD